MVIYRSANQVPGKYEEVAVLNSKGESGLTDEAAMFKSMQKKAGELGANAIILDAVSEPSAGAKVASAVFGTGAGRKGALSRSMSSRTLVTDDEGARSHGSPARHHSLRRGLRRRFRHGSGSSV